VGLLANYPGWAGALSSGWAKPAEPGWALAAPRPSAAPRLGPPADSPRGPRRPCAPFASRLGRQAGCPGWASLNALAGLPPLAPRLGRIRRIRPGQDFPSRPPLSDRLGRIIVFRLGQAGIPGPGRIIPFVGRDILSWARFIPSRTYSSSSIASSTLCQSWDASRLGLAYSPSSYAGLGTPIGSDQHIPPLLVSLILRRRIRLMTW
jgi:hypothetical protein